MDKKKVLSTQEVFFFSVQGLKRSCQIHKQNQVMYCRTQNIQVQDRTQCLLPFFFAPADECGGGGDEKGNVIPKGVKFNFSKNVIFPTTLLSKTCKMLQVISAFSAADSQTVVRDDSFLWGRCRQCQLFRCFLQNSFPLEGLRLQAGI